MAGAIRSATSATSTEQFGRICNELHHEVSGSSTSLVLPAAPGRQVGLPGDFAKTESPSVHLLQSP
jgi:hypothetical protein